MKIEEFLTSLVGDDPSGGEGAITANELDNVCRVLGPVADVHLLEADVSRAVAEIQEVAGTSYTGRYIRCRQKVCEIEALGGTVGKWSDRWFWLVEDASAAVFQEEHEDQDGLAREKTWYERRVFFLHAVVLVILRATSLCLLGGGPSDTNWGRMQLRVVGESEPAAPSCTPVFERTPSSGFVPHVLVVRHTLPFSA